MKSLPLVHFPGRSISRFRGAQERKHTTPARDIKITQQTHCYPHHFFFSPYLYGFFFFRGLVTFVFYPKRGVIMEWGRPNGLTLGKNGTVSSTMRYHSEILLSHARVQGVTFMLCADEACVIDGVAMLCNLCLLHI